MTAPRPQVVPETTALTSPYWTQAADGRVLLQRCPRCGLVWHPPAPVCPGCRDGAPQWLESAGLGTLYSYTRVDHAVHAAVADVVPYLVALVDLDEGPRIITNLVGVPDEAALGVRTRVILERGLAAGGLQLPIARPHHPGTDGAAGPVPRA
jgi:uncharacterized protein